MINESIQNRIRGLIQCVRSQPETQEVVTKYILEIVQTYQKAIQETSDNMEILKEHLANILNSDLSEMAAMQFVEKMGLQEEFRKFVESELSNDPNAFVTGVIQ
ncbi:hypothetical protein ACK8P5_16600 [Paenibacillus sp. EC2-1]|uniref:hypothetical protein n=1 Tax=Paenibacillus sp. EC2-1 TaxID=3388665 RepID=UPI003BEEBFD3